MRNEILKIKRPLSSTKLVFGLGVLFISIIYLINSPSNSSTGSTIIGTMFIILGIGAIYLYFIEYFNHLKIPILIFKENGIELNQEVNTKLWNDNLQTWETFQYKKQFIPYSEIKKVDIIYRKEGSTQKTTKSYLLIDGQEVIYLFSKDLAIPLENLKNELQLR